MKKFILGMLVLTIIVGIIGCGGGGGGDSSGGGSVVVNTTGGGSSTANVDMSGVWTFEPITNSLSTGAVGSFTQSGNNFSGTILGNSGITNTVVGTINGNSISGTTTSSDGETAAFIGTVIASDTVTFTAGSESGTAKRGYKDIFFKYSYAIYGLNTNFTSYSDSNIETALDIGKATLIGTSPSTVFNLSGYNRFILHIPYDAPKLQVDAFKLGDGTYVNSGGTPEYTHFSNGIPWTVPTSDTNIEGSPDGKYIESDPGKDGRYSFTTSGQTTLTLIKP